MKTIMKTNYDAVSEAKQNGSRFNNRTTTNPIDKRVALGRCFICGQRCSMKKDICIECERDFPSIKKDEGAK